MKKADHTSFLLFICFVFFLGYKTEIKAEQNKMPVLWKKFNNLTNKNLNKNKSGRMTPLSNIKQFNEKTDEEKTKLRVIQVIEQGGKTDEYYYFNLARAYEGEKKYDKAVKNYKLAIDSNIEYIPAYSHLGLLYAEMGNYKASIEVFEKYLEFSNHPKERKLINEFIEKIKSFVD